MRIRFNANLHFDPAVLWSFGLPRVCCSYTCKKKNETNLTVQSSTRYVIIYEYTYIYCITFVFLRKKIQRFITNMQSCYSLETSYTKIKLNIFKGSFVFKLQERNSLKRCPPSGWLTIFIIDLHFLIIKEPIVIFSKPLIVNGNKENSIKRKVSLEVNRLINCFLRHHNKTNKKEKSYWTLFFYLFFRHFDALL